MEALPVTNSTEHPTGNGSIAVLSLPATTLRQQYQQPAPSLRPSPMTSAPFFSTSSRGTDPEPAFVMSSGFNSKPTLRSMTSTAAAGSSLGRLEGARRLSGHVPGTGAFHLVQPLATAVDQHGKVELIGSEVMITSMSLTAAATNGHRQGSLEEIDKRLSKRKRKACNLDGSVCTICGVTVRPVELPAHLEIEVEKLNKLTRPGKSSRDSASHSKKVAAPTVTVSKKRRDSEDEIPKSKESRLQEYMRIKQNRLDRLNARLGRCRKAHSNKTTSEASPISMPALCPICHDVLTGPVEDRNSHAEACLRKVSPGQRDVDEDIDVDGDEFDEYTWCGQTRVRATSMLESRFKEAGFDVGRREVDCDTELNVDDDDTAEFGPEQFTEGDIIPCPSDDSTEDKQRQALRDAVVGNEERTTSPDIATDPWLESTSYEPPGTSQQPSIESKNSSSETIVECLKGRIRELQEQLDTTTSARIKCLICMEAFSVPLVSIQCWHVHCQQCWLRTLGAKKLCPQCNMITSPGQLRRIYL